MWDECLSEGEGKEIVDEFERKLGFLRCGFEKIAEWRGDLGGGKEQNRVKGGSTDGVIHAAHAHAHAQIHKHTINEIKHKRNNKEVVGCWRVIWSKWNTTYKQCHTQIHTHTHKQHHIHAHTYTHTHIHTDTESDKSHTIVCTHTHTHTISAQNTNKREVGFIEIV